MDIFFGILSVLLLWVGIPYWIYRLATRKKRKGQAKKLTEEKETKWREEYSGVINDNKVEQRWATTIGGMHGHGERLMDGVARRIEKEHIPDTAVSRRPMTIEGAAEPLPFVVVSNANPILKAHKVLISAVDYGERLNIRWYVIMDITEIHNGALIQKSMATKEALSSYVAIVRSLFDAELKELMDDLQLDFTKVDTHTRGFGN